MNTATKVLLIAGGLGLFYAVRRYADNKFATTPIEPKSPVVATNVITMDQVRETVKRILPDDILPDPTPAPTTTQPAPTAITTQPVTTTRITTATPIIAPAPLPVKESPLIQATYPTRTIDKIALLDQRLLLR